jgi:hypothetical protein
MSASLSAVVLLHSRTEVEGVARRAGLLSARLATTQQTSPNGASLFCLMRGAGLALEFEKEKAGARSPRLQRPAAESGPYLGRRITSTFTRAPFGASGTTLPFNG